MYDDGQFVREDLLNVGEDIKAEPSHEKVPAVYEETSISN